MCRPHGRLRGRLELSGERRSGELAVLGRCSGGAVSALRSQVLAQDREGGFVRPEYAVVAFDFP